MARHPRLTCQGVALHVIQRGNNRNDCFRVEGDYWTYLSYLRHVAGRHGCAVHAYCLMTNHVHLLVTPAADGDCGALMRDLGRCYVRYFNRRHARSGTLWEGRFRSNLVESERYVLACHRYIELNPVRAGMVAAPLEYAWSSHGGNTGARTDLLLTPHAEFLALATSESARHAAYRRLVEEAVEGDLLREIRAAANGGFPLASDDFKSRIMASGARVRRGKPGPRGG